MFRSPIPLVLARDSKTKLIRRRHESSAKLDDKTRPCRFLGRGDELRKCIVGKGGGERWWKVGFVKTGKSRNDALLSFVSTIVSLSFPSTGPVRRTFLSRDIVVFKAFFRWSTKLIWRCDPVPTTTLLSGRYEPEGQRMTRHHKRGMWIDIASYGLSWPVIWNIGALKNHWFLWRTLRLNNGELVNAPAIWFLRSITVLSNFQYWNVKFVCNYIKWNDTSKMFNCISRL